MRPTIIRVILAAIIALPLAASAADYAPVATRAATQTFAIKYSFSTTQTKLLETASAIYDMGSDTIKFDMSAAAFGSTGYSLPTNPNDYPSLRAMAENEQSYRQLFDMPFRTYIFWTNVRSIPNSNYYAYWRDGLSVSEAQTEYAEIRELCEYLLNHYNGTGKTFLLGNWEGDWAVRGNTNANANPSSTAVQGMIDWLRNRQKAVEDARAAVPNSDVKVLHYCEVNLVNAWEQGWTKPWGQVTVHKDVIPHVAIDMVSYSAYECCHILDPNLPFPGWLIQDLNAIESNTTFTAAAPYGKKVFIGEYGATTYGGLPGTDYTPAQQGDLAAGVNKGAASWGCPFVLYWEMYDNENRGYWLIDSNNVKQPSYYRYQEFLGKVNTVKNLYRQWLGRNPSYAEVSAFAGGFDTYTVSGQLNTLLNSAEYASSKTNAQYLSLLFTKLLASSNTSDPDYVSYLAQLNSGTSRSTVLDNIMNSTRFKAAVSNSQFTKSLYTGTLRRASFSWSATDALATLAGLEGGASRSTVWRSFLNSQEFRDAELLMRSDNAVDSPTVASKYFFSVTLSQADDSVYLYE